MTHRRPPGRPAGKRQKEPAEFVTARAWDSARYLFGQIAHIEATIRRSGITTPLAQQALNDYRSRLARLAG